MISPLRTLHRRAFVALAAVLPVLFVVGLSVRRAAPVSERLPSSIAETPDEVGAASRGCIGGQPVRARLLAGDILEIQSAGPLLAPDLLVYWSDRLVADLATATSTQPTLLGPLRHDRPVRLVLPPSRDGGGGLLLLSLAHDAAIGSVPLGSELELEACP